MDVLHTIAGTLIDLTVSKTRQSKSWNAAGIDMRIGIIVISLFFSLFCQTAIVRSEESSAQRMSNSQQTQAEAQATLKSISKGVQDLKQDVVSLNKDLRLLEETILFPSSTKYSVFVSMSAGQFFSLESVKLKLDGKLVATHIYSEKQRQALARGGVQKLYITNLNEGDHNATAFFTGLGPNGRAYKLAKSLDFKKGSAGEYLELAIRDDGEAQEPIIFVKQW